MVQRMKEKKIEILIVMIGFLVYLIWAMRLPVSMAPDEPMRYTVTQWIFENNCLPHGDEKELIHSIWGFSYGFTPYLPSLISVCFMKITALFSETSNSLMIAARMTSVLAGTGTLVCSLMIGERIFERKTTKYLFSLLTGFFPQFVFLCAYCNNDSFSVFTVTLIFLAWIVGKENIWDRKSCILLAVAISLCALTYYNAYAYILCSIFIFIQGILQNRDIDKRFQYLIKHGLVIAGIVLVLAGWFFIRNAMIHNGDFLGMKSMYECGEIYAQDPYKMSNRATLEKAGYHYLQTIWTNDWLKGSVLSFIGNFGYLTVGLERVQYFFYLIVICLGVILHIVSIVKNKKNLFLSLNLMMCIIIPFLLSVQYSYAIDFQAQGRYIMSALPALMYMVANGYEYAELENGCRPEKVGYVKIITGIWILSFIYIVFFVIKPNCMGGIW